MGSTIAQFWSYQYALYVCSITSFIGAIVTLAISKSNTKTEEVQSLGTNRSWKQLFKKNSVAILLVAPVIIFMCSTGVNSYVPLYASETIGMPTIQIGTLFTLASIAGFLATPLFGWVSDQVGRKSVILSGFTLSAAGFAILFFARSPVHMALALIGLETCFLPMTPLLLAMLSEATPQSLLGTSMGIYSTFENLGTVLAPPVYSVLWSVYTPSSIFPVSALIMLLGAFLLLPTARTLTASSDTKK